MLFQTGETELSSFERKCYWTTCGNPGWVWRWRGAQAFPKMLALSLIVSLTPFPYDPPSSWKPAMGTRCFACRQSCNCSYQVFHLVRGKKITFYPKSCQRTTAFSFHLRRFLMDLSNCSHAQSLDVSTTMIQEWHGCGWMRMLDSAPEAEWYSALHGRKGSTLLQVTLKKTSSLESCAARQL